MDSTPPVTYIPPSWIHRGAELQDSKGNRRVVASIHCAPTREETAVSLAIVDSIGRITAKKPIEQRSCAEIESDWIITGRYHGVVW